MAKYKNIIPENTKVHIKKLNLTIRGGFFYSDKVLKKIHDEGYTAFVEKIATKKKKEDEKDSTD